VRVFRIANSNAIKIPLAVKRIELGEIVFGVDLAEWNIKAK
jgi:hypothetical protein